MTPFFRPALALLVLALCALAPAPCAHAADDIPVARMDAAELAARLGGDDLIVLDVRWPGQWQESETKIPGAAWRDPLATAAWAPEIPRDRDVVLYCA